MMYNKPNFPYYPETDEYRSNELSKFLTFDTWGLDTLYQKSIDDISLEFTAKSYKHGINFLWSFFNDFWAKTKTDHRKTPYEFYLDTELLNSELTKSNLKPNNMTVDAFRNFLKRPKFVNTINNFRPLTAYAIYENLLEDFNSVVYDPCHGFGGRLLGAIKSEKVGTYIGIDADKQISLGLSNCLDYIKSKDSLLNTNVNLSNNLAESFALPENSVDLVFTSPPYFDKEKYSLDVNQSYIKYKTKEDWLKNFLTKLLDNAFYCLKPQGLCCINIANIDTFKDLEISLINQALSVGFKLKEIHKILLTPRYGSAKFEPLYVFNK